ncbi:MAG: beta-ketoacyl synthase N-terminal-like domain-containing protein [Desulfuromonadales bacterium]
MNAVQVVAISAVTAFGDLESTWDRLLTGATAISPVARFDTARYVSSCAACLTDLDPDGKQSRIHRLLDRLLAGFGPVPADARLLTATTKWAADSIERHCRGDMVEAGELLPGTFPAEMRRRFQLTDPGMNVNAACASSTIALARGAAMIAAGTTSVVLVCCADLVSEFVLSGFSALQGLSPEPCRPFDRRRSGLTLGEGGAALLLMDATRAGREGWPDLGRIRGWGVAGDAHHITAPARDGAGLVQACTAALGRAGVKPGEIGSIHAHGTGTVFNDLMELTAFRHLFGRRTLPVYGIKGAVGHTLGAAGGIEAAVTLKALASRQAPPTAGYGEPEPEAAGWLADQPQSLAGPLAFTTNSGFGGINAALVLEHGHD